MIIKFTKEEIRERDSFEASYEKLLQELELKIESLRDDPEPDEKKLAALDKARQKIKPPKKGRNADDEQAYFSSPEYQAYLDKINKNEEEYHAVIKAWEDAGSKEWKAARNEYDRLIEERDKARRDFLLRCENRHFNALGGDVHKIYRDATQQALQLIENRYRYYEGKLEDGEYTAFSAIDVRRQDDGSFKLDKEETRKAIYRCIDRHLNALKDAEPALVNSLKEYVEQILTRSPYVTSEGVRGAIIETKKKPQRESDVVLAKRPTKYVTPVDKVTKQIFSNSDITRIVDDDGLVPITLGRKGNAIARVAIDYKDLLSKGNISEIPKLNQMDYSVLDAIISLYCAGNRLMTYDMIYRAMTGKIYGKVEVPDEVKSLIDEALDKFRGIFKLEYEYTDENGEKVMRFIDEPFLTYQRVKDVYVNGKIIKDGAIRLSDDAKLAPPALRWARLNGNEIDTRDITLLDVPRLNNSEESFLIKNYCYRRIINMRNAFERIKKSRSELAEKERNIRLDSLCSEIGLDFEKLTRDKKHDIKTKLDKIFGHWKEKGLIADYVYKKDKSANNAIYAVSVSFLPAK